MKTYVYIDGFNLYYGAVRGTPYRWLDIRKLCQLLLPKHQIATVKYFTARVSGRPGDPDKSTRQQTFLRALATLPDFDIGPTCLWRALPPWGRSTPRSLQGPGSFRHTSLVVDAGGTHHLAWTDANGTLRYMRY